MNDFYDNPFDIPEVDKKDIPVLDDIVTLGAIHETIAPNVEVQVESETDHKPDAGFSATGEPDPTEQKAFIDKEQLAILIEEIAGKVQQELVSRIEDTIRKALEEGLHNTLQQQENLIKESILTHLNEHLPDILNTTSDRSK